MIKRILFSLFLAGACLSQESLAKPTSEIEFQNRSIHFRAERSQKKLNFSDELGPRDLEISKCNEKLVDHFWQGLQENARSLRSTRPARGRLASNTAWLKIEGLKFQVLDFEPALTFFNKVPGESHVLFAESKRLCK